MNWFRSCDLVIFEEIDSTNEEAKRLAKAGNQNIIVIWARSQINGKGRHGRIWQSGCGDLTFSILLHPKFHASKASQLSFVAALAVSKSLEEFISNGTIQHKWPNDILVNGKKISGILLECGSRKKSSSNLNNDPKIDWLTVGIGINLTPKQTKKGEIFPYPVTSLFAETGIKIFPEKMLDVIMRNYFSLYGLWLMEDFAPIRQAWLEKAFGLGDVITTNIHGNRISGVFETIDSNGNIIIRLACGEKYYISSGEVFFKCNDNVKH